MSPPLSADRRPWRLRPRTPRQRECLALAARLRARRRPGAPRREPPFFASPTRTLAMRPWARATVVRRAQRLRERVQRTLHTRERYVVSLAPAPATRAAAVRTIVSVWRTTQTAPSPPRPPAVRVPAVPEPARRPDVMLLRQHTLVRERLRVEPARAAPVRTVVVRSIGSHPIAASLPTPPARAQASLAERHAPTPLPASLSTPRPGSPVPAALAPVPAPEPAVDLDELVSEVLQRIERRAIAQRERLGTV